MQSINGKVWTHFYRSRQNSLMFLGTWVHSSFFSPRTDVSQASTVNLTEQRQYLRNYTKSYGFKLCYINKLYDYGDDDKDDDDENSEL